MQVTVLDFTGVYEAQPFMQELRMRADTRHIGCGDIPGTDCYCDDEAVETIRKRIAEVGITDASGIHFFDNGNYHYMSKIWTDMVKEPFSLVIFDHHPDMQEPRFSNILSCGGWVKKVMEENPFVDNVVIIGVADHLADEFRNDKVTFIRESELPSVTVDSIAALRLQNDNKSRAQKDIPLYISIDKDALSTDYAATNWDQGSLSLEHTKAIIDALAQDHRIIGVDICGERARDFAGDEQHSAQEADALNDRTNRELAGFLASILP